MNYLKKIILPVFLTGLWINFSETIRWELVIKYYWIENHQNLGLTFPNEFVNIIMWMIWGFMFAFTIFVLSRKYTLLQTTSMSWFVAFVMMWVVVWNVGILPIGMLWINAPLSFFESFVGTLICRKFL